MSRKTIFLKPVDYLGLVDDLLGSPGTSRERFREGLGYWVPCPLCRDPLLLLHRPDFSIVAHCTSACSEGEILNALKERLRYLTLLSSKIVHQTAADIQKQCEIEYQKRNRVDQLIDQLGNPWLIRRGDKANGYREYNPKNPPSTDSAVKSTDDKLLEKVANAGYVLAAAIEALVVELKAMNADSELKAEREAIQTEDSNDAHDCTLFLLP